MKTKIVKRPEYPYKAIGCIHNFFYKDGRRWTEDEYNCYQKIRKNSLYGEMKNDQRN